MQQSLLTNNCRNCNKTFKENEGVYVELSTDWCHCEKCHSKLFNDEEWNDLYNLWNIDDNGDIVPSGSYYYTTVN